jgi:hypothetical protein
VATLGLQPQIITRALDQLRPLEPRLELAVILHTAEYRPHPQWPTLADFSAYLSYTYAPLRVELSLLQQPGEAPLRDVVSPADAEVAFRVIYNVTRDLKRRGYRLHSLPNCSSMPRTSCGTSSRATNTSATASTARWASGPTWPATSCIWSKSPSFSSVASPP